MAKYNKLYVLINIIDGVSDFSKDDIKNQSILIRSVLDFEKFIKGCKGVEMLSYQVDTSTTSTLQVDQAIVDKIQAEAFRKQWMVSETIELIFTDWISYSGTYSFDFTKDR